MTETTPEAREAVAQAYDRLEAAIDEAFPYAGCRDDLRDLYAATLSPPAISEAVEAEREGCARLAEKWRDENRAACSKARKRAGLCGEDGLADMLDGAAIECNAIAQAIRARTSISEVVG